MSVTLTEPQIQSQHCDRCGESTRAQHLASKGSGLLFLCGHHTRVMQSSLLAQGWSVTAVSSVEEVTV